MWYIILSLIGFGFICKEFWITRKEKFNFPLLLFIITYIFVIFCSLMVVRLMMVYGIFINIPIVYLTYYLWDKSKISKDNKIIYRILFWIMVYILLISFLAFYETITRMAYCDFNSLVHCQWD